MNQWLQAGRHHGIVQRPFAWGGAIRWRLGTVARRGEDDAFG
jgi:hypothetical protein